MAWMAGVARRSGELEHANGDRRSADAVAIPWLVVSRPDGERSSDR